MQFALPLLNVHTYDRETRYKLLANIADYNANNSKIYIHKAICMSMHIRTARLATY